jgi:hypothetical protein
MISRIRPVFAALALLSTLNSQLSTVLAFEGRIHATITQGNQSSILLYTVGTNFLRVEMTATNWPNPVDILDRNSGALLLLFPHNRSFVRLKLDAGSTALARPGPPEGGTPNAPSMPTLPVAPGSHGMSSLPAMPGLPPGLPPGIGPQAPIPNAPGVSAMPATPNPPGMPARPLMPAMPNMPPGGGPPSTPGAGGMSSMPAMPMMPMMPMEPMELKATGEKTNLLGFACGRFEIKQRGETMEIWATDQLLPFQNYVRNQPHRFGPRMIEEQWAGLLTANKLFPLRASLHFENGAERYRFEVQAITPQKLKDEDLKLFQPPEGYFEIEPLPF